MTKVDIHKKAMIEALKESLGIVSTACSKVGICRTSHYDWMNEDEEYNKSINDISEEAIDFVESALFKKIKEGDTTSIIFYLKTKGKKRGYIERQEITGKDGVPIQPVIRFTND